MGIITNSLGTSTQSQRTTILRNQMNATTIAAFFIGGLLGMLVMALAAVSKRADELEQWILEASDQDDQETDDEPPTYVLETTEPLDEDTLNKIVEAFEEQTGGRVILLDAYRIERDAEDQQ